MLKAYVSDIGADSCCHAAQMYSSAVDGEGSEQASVQTIGEDMVRLTAT